MHPVYIGAGMDRVENSVLPIYCTAEMELRWSV